MPGLITNVQLAANCAFGAHNSMLHSVYILLAYLPSSQMESGMAL